MFAYLSGIVCMLLLDSQCHATLEICMVMYSNCKEVIVNLLWMPTTIVHNPWNVVVQCFWILFPGEGGKAGLWKGNENYLIIFGKLLLI